MIDVKIDAENLVRLIESVDPKIQVRMIKRAYRAEGQRWKKEAINLFSTKNLNNAASIAKSGIRNFITRYGPAGFGLTVRTKKQKFSTLKMGDGMKLKVRGFKTKGMHTNRRGLDKPLALWFNAGTDDRYKRSTRAYTGRIDALGVLAESQDKEFAVSAVNVRKALIESLLKETKKYGAKPK